MLERAVGAAFALSIAAVVAMVVVSTIHSSIAPDYAQEGPLYLADDRTNTGTPLLLAAFEGDAPLSIQAVDQGTYRVIVAKVAVDDLRQAALELGINTAEFAVRLPGEPEMALLAYGASSPHLGCTIGLLSQPSTVITRANGSDSLWFIDPCHQGMWDALGLGAPRRAAQPGGFPLDIVPISIRDGALWMDDPIEQSRPYEASSQTTFALA